MSKVNDRIERDRMFAHDLRNPLTAVRVLAQMLAEDVPDDLQGDVDDILEAVDTAVLMVDGFSDAAAVEGGRSPKHALQRTDLSEVVRAVAGRSAFRSCVVVGDLPHVFVSASPVAERVIAHVIYSASRLLGSKSKARVSVTARGEVCVHHPGLRLESSAVSELLQLYGALALKSRRLRAAPIGLYHCREMMDNHGGSLSIQSEPAGIVVVLQFPLSST